MRTERANIALARAGYAGLLNEEFLNRFGVRGHCLNDDAVAFDEGVKLPHYEDTVFTRQYLPMAVPFHGADLKEAIDFVYRKIEVMAGRSNRQAGRWTLHAFALEDNAATQHAAKIEKALLAAVKTKLPRLYQRFLSAADMAQAEHRGDGDFLVQIYVPSPQELWLSVSGFAAGVSRYIGGNLRMRARDGAPSRSARKLEEAFLALGCLPKAGETAVDLGAAPGGWTFSLARRGASVLAVDHADLSLPAGKALTKRVTQVKENGIKYRPEEPVDWLCCDMLVASHEALRVLKAWLDNEWMRYFVVNLKLPKNEPWAAIDQALAFLHRYPWAVMKARHLYHDRYEVTLLGAKAPISR